MELGEHRGTEGRPRGLYGRVADRLCSCPTAALTSVLVLATLVLVQYFLHRRHPGGGKARRGALVGARAGARMAGASAPAPTRAPLLRTGGTDSPAESDPETERLIDAINAGQGLRRAEGAGGRSDPPQHAHG